MTEPSSPSSPFPHSLQALQARHGERYRWRVLLTVMIEQHRVGWRRGCVPFAIATMKPVTAGHC